MPLELEPTRAQQLARRVGDQHLVARLAGALLGPRGRVDRIAITMTSTRLAPTTAGQLFYSDSPQLD